MFHIPAHKSIPNTQPAASGEPADPDPLHLSRILHEMAGAVSMCWEPRPSGEFESSMACGYVAAAIAEIRSRMTATAQPAAAQVPLTEDQKDTMWRAAYFEKSYRYGAYEWYAQGVEDAERAHNIAK